MQLENDRRSERRVRFFWPLWFGYSDRGELFRGQLIDLCPSGVCFAVDENHCPGVGQHVLTRFSYPYNEDENFQLADYANWAEVIRVDNSVPGRRRVAMRLHRRLENPPSENLATPQFASLAGA